MPLYEFRNKELGLSVDVVIPVDKLCDQIVLERVRVPERIATGLNREPTQAERVIKGYHKLEETGALKNSRYTPEQVKQAWAQPDTN